MSYGPRPRPIEERFWEKVDDPGAHGACWVWMGAKDPAGYGLLYGGPLYYQRLNWVKAHRLSWEIANSQRVPEELCILHHCDNPPCVNPAHLYAGSKRNNAEDRAERRRGKEHRQRGEDNDNAKLSEADVRGIISELQKLPRRSQAAIAADFGIKQPQVSRIMRRESWAHLWPEDE